MKIRTQLSACLLITLFGVQAAFGQHNFDDRVTVEATGTLGGKFYPGGATLNIGTGGTRLLLDNNEIYGNNALYFGSAYNHGIFFRNVDTNGSEDLMALTSNGNLGIGTNTPSTRLHILGASNTLKISKGTGYSPIQFYSDGDGTHNNSPISIYSYGSGGNQDLNFYIQNWSGSYKFRMGASGGGYNIATITKGGTASNGADACYGIFNVLGLNQATGVRLNGAGDSYFIGGNIGIGTSTPGEELEVNGTILSDNLRTDQNNTKYSQIIRNGNGTALYVNQVAANKPIMRLSSGTAAANEGVKFSVESTGATRIGTHQIPSGYMLAVSGKATMTEVKVQATPWPDYVFTPSYDLKSLDQVETFINENGHLPNIPSAQEVEENNGIELGEMNAKLLEKIEELTLHLIQQNKELSELKIQNEELINRIEKIESSVEK